MSPKIKVANTQEGHRLMKKSKELKERGIDLGKNTDLRPYRDITGEEELTLEIVRSNNIIT